MSKQLGAVLWYPSYDQKPGRVELGRLLDALNSIDPASRSAMVSALRIHDPKTRYFTSPDGRVDAVPAP